MDANPALGRNAAAASAIDRAAQDAWPALVRLAYRFCWHEADAEDAVQTALLIANERAWQLTSSGRALTWLKAIVVRQAIQQARLRRRRGSHEALAALGSTGGRTETDADADAEMAGHLREQIQRLPEGQQIALVLRHLEELPYAEVAELMGVSESTARVQVRNAREALRAGLAPDAPVDRSRTAASRGIPG